MKNYLFRVGLWSCINGLLFITRQDYQRVIDIGGSVLSLDLGLWSFSIGALFVLLSVPLSLDNQEVGTQ